MGRRNLFVPLLVVTLLCVGLVEVGYFALEHFVLRRAEQVEGAVGWPAVPGETDKEGIEVSNDTQLIVERNLFRGAPVSDDPFASPEAEEQLREEVQLNIVLMGTVGGDTPRAFILDKLTSRQQVYEVGDEVQGMLVKEIQRGRVSLQHNNREEILDLSEAAQLRPLYQGVEPNVIIEPDVTEILEQSPPEEGPEQFGSRFLEAEIERVATEAGIVRSRTVRLPRPSGAPPANSSEGVTE